MDEKHTKAILALEDGTIFHGTGFGAIKNLEYSCGELVFNTSMTGYQEIISDPSYCEQIILFTQPHIGVVGVNNQDIESNQDTKIWSKGIVIKSLSHISSNWRSHNNLNAYLEENNLLGIADVDTRALTNILRTKGSMRSCIYILDNENKLDITKQEQKAVELAKNSRLLDGLDLAVEVTCDKKYIWTDDIVKFNGKNHKDDLTASDKDKYNIVVYDFGVKQQILKLLVNRNCHVTVVPAKTSVNDVLKLNPDGILLSNGPGDPKACQYAIDNTKKLLSLNMPIFGICLGFQILALAMGADTQKMKFGHHGGNHPVKDLNNNKVLITSQNHGFNVSQDSIKSSDIVITHKSLFDQTIQGIKHKSLPVFGFQGHPEASPGPNDIEYLFDNFIINVKNYKAKSFLNASENKIASSQA